MSSNEHSYHKEYYEKNKDARRAYAVQYYHKNKERLNQLQKARKGKPPKERIVLTEEERAERRREASRRWHKDHPIIDKSPEYKARKSRDTVKHMQEARKRGQTALVLAADCQKVENYKAAQQDDFDGKKWVLHHRLENEFIQETLSALGLYFFRPANELIWLPAKEHKRDASIGARNPDDSVWHKKMFDRYGTSALERFLLLLIVKYLEEFGLSSDNAYKNFISGKGSIEDVIRWLVDQLHFPQFFYTNKKRCESFLDNLSKSLPFILKAKGMLVSSSDSSSETNT